MTSLSMNTETARATATAIGTFHNNVDSELAALVNRANSLTTSNDWQGNAATQFQTEFETWSNDFRNRLAALEELQRRLNSEIVEWENIDRGLSG